MKASVARARELETGWIMTMRLRSSSSLRRLAITAALGAVLFSLDAAALAQGTSGDSVPPPAASAPTSAAPSTAAPTAAPTIAVPPPPAQETVENPYSLTALWQGGDEIARGTIVLLVIMSMSTWYVMITKFIEQTRLLAQARRANRSFWSAPSLRAGADALDKASVFRLLVDDGLKAAAHHEGTLTEQIDRHTWITMSLQRDVDAIANRLQSGLAVLTTVGSTAPFVGLFGTVWGIYHALTAIGIAGQASIDKVAGPVGEALIMTAIGLAVAVPAVLAYNWMVRRNKVVMDRIRQFSSELLAVLISTPQKSQPPLARSA
jgi:biopolymer transport protein ExbB